MSQTSRLTLAYLASHPADAARVLDTLDAEDAGLFLASVPSRIAGPVMAQMLPYRAARCLAAASGEAQANLVGRLSVQHASAVLRHLERTERDRLLERLSTARAVTLRLLIGYPENTVGAWVDPEVTLLSQGLLVDEALKQVQRAETEPGERLYVVGKDRRLLGTVRLARMLRSAAKEPLANIMDSPPDTLSAQTSVAEVRRHGAWTRHDSLPVVEGGKRFVGVLHHSSLRRATDGLLESHAAGYADDTLASAASLYWQAFSGLIGFSVSLLPVPSGNIPDGEKS